MYSGEIKTGDYFIWKPLIVLGNIEITSLQIVKIRYNIGGEVSIVSGDDDSDTIEIKEDTFRENVFDAKINLKQRQLNLVYNEDKECILIK